MQNNLGLKYAQRICFPGKHLFVNTSKFYQYIMIIKGQQNEYCIHLLCELLSMATGYNYVLESRPLMELVPAVYSWPNDRNVDYNLYFELRAGERKLFAAYNSKCRDLLEFDQILKKDSMSYHEKIQYLMSFLNHILASHELGWIRKPDCVYLTKETFICFFLGHMFNGDYTLHHILRIQSWFVKKIGRTGKDVYERYIEHLNVLSRKRFPDA